MKSKGISRLTAPLGAISHRPSA